MKSPIISTVLALMISAGITSQVTAQTEQQNRKHSEVKAQRQAREQQTQDQVQKHEKIRQEDKLRVQTKTRTPREERKLLKAQKMAQKKANHGLVVREIAKTTESGKGKGETVSTTAKTRGELQHARIKSNISAKNQLALKGARGPALQNKIGSPMRKGPARK